MDDDALLARLGRSRLRVAELGAALLSLRAQTRRVHRESSLRVDRLRRVVAPRPERATRRQRG